MGQTTILAAGTAAATSTDVSVAAGKSAIFELLSASEPKGVELLIVKAVTGGADSPVELLGSKPVVVTNPTDAAITYRVKRQDITASGQSVGAVATT